MANFFTRLGKTLTDFGSDILYGVSKGLEGIVDLGIGLTGTVGGWFDDDFEKTMKDAVGVDFVGERMRMNKLRELAEKDSLLEGTAVGDFMDEVSVGVGNMLPAVLVGAFTGGTGALLTLGASAAGGSTEEAVNDGAELDRALGYGIVRGGTEMVTEKVLGGATKYITGGGALAKSTGKVAKTGIRRIGQEALEEAGEEITSELLNPVSKTIYKGSEALSEYGEGDYWRGVGRAGLAGAATSVAYGGTVGYFSKTSGRYADVAGSVEQINEIEKNLAKIDAEGARTDKIDARADELIRGNLENISRALKASKPGQKKTLMKSLARAGLADNFNADGSIKDISVNNNYKKSSYSASMRGKEAVIASDLNTLTDNMVNEYAKKNNVSVEEARAKAGEIKVYEGELSSTGTENLTKMKKAVNALNERGGQRLSFVVVEPNNQFNGVIKGDVMYIGADALESGKFAGTLVHEYTHFEEGSKEYKKLIKYLAEDSSLFVEARDNVVGTDAGYGLDAEALASVQDKITKGEQLTADEALAYGTYQTEVAAHMSEAMLGSEAFIDKLVKNDGSLVEKLFERFKRLKESLSSIGNSEARAELSRIRKAERLYLKAAEKAGNKELSRRLRGYVDEDKEAKSQTSENLDAEGVDIEGEIQYNKKSNRNPKKKRIYYNEYNSLAMQWAFSSKTKPGDIKVLYNPQDNTWNKLVADDTEERYGTILSIKDTPENADKINNLRDEVYNENHRKEQRDSEILYEDFERYWSIGRSYSNDNLDVKESEANGHSREFYGEKNNSNGEGSSRTGGVDSNDIKRSRKTAPNGTVDNYTETEYNNYGWARANNVLSASESERLRSRFAAATQSLEHPPKTKSGEFMIAIGDDADNKIAYMRGTIDDPYITKVVEILETDETILDEYRRDIYEAERRGVQRETSNLCRCYYSTDRGYRQYLSDRSNTQNSRYNNELGADRGAGSGRAPKIKEILFDEDGNEISRKVQYSRKKSSDTITMSRGEAAKRNANYENDVIFDKKDVVGGLENVEYFASIPSDIREAYIDEIWRLFNTFVDPARRKFYIDSISKKLYVELAEHGILAPQEVVNLIQKTKRRINQLSKKTDRSFNRVDAFRKLETNIHELLDSKIGLREKDRQALEKCLKKFSAEAYEKKSEQAAERMTKALDEIAKLEELLNELEKEYSAKHRLGLVKLNEFETHVREALEEIAEKSGKASVRTRMKEKLSKLTESERADYLKIRNEYDQTKEKLDASQSEFDLIEAVKKLDGFKKGRFVNATNSKVEAFKKSIDQLTRLCYRGRLTKSDIRGKVKAFCDWYEANSAIFLGEGTEYRVLYSDIVAEWLKQISSGTGDLSLRELKMLTEAINNFLHIEEKWTKIWVDGKFVELEPIVDDFYQKAEENNSVPRGVGGKFMDFLYENPLGRVALNPQTIAEYYDGGLDGFNTYAFKLIQQAEINKKVLKIKLYEKLSEFGENHKDYLKGRKKRSIDFLGTELKVDTASELYMALKDEDSALALVLNGFSYYDKNGKIVKREGIEPDLKEKMIEAKKYSAVNLKKAAIGIAERTAAQLAEKFTPEDLEFIKIQEEIYNVEGRKLKIERDKQRFGMSAIKENGPYHHPLSRDGIAYTVGEFQIKDKGKAASSNKHRELDAQQPLFIVSDIKVLEKYVNEITNYYCVSPARDTYARILDYNRNQENPNRPEKLREKLRNDFANRKYVKKHGESKTTAMDVFYDDLFADIEGGTKRRRSEIEEAIRGNVAKALLGFNPKTILTQCTSLFSAMSIINPKHFPKAFMHMSGDVDKYSKLAMLRYIEDGAFAAQANVEAKARISRGVESFSDLMLLGIGKTDRGIVRVLWGAAQVQVEAEQKLAFGTEENLKAAGELLDKVILDTQQNALITTKSAAMRSDSPILRVSTMFTSDVLANICKVWRHFSKAAQLLRLANARERAGDIAGAKSLRKKAAREFKDFAKSVGALATTAALGALIAWLFRFLFHRDEEVSIEEKLQNLGIDFAGNMISGIPIINDIYSYFATGYGVEDFSFNAFNEVLDGLKGIYNVLQTVGSDTVDERTAARTIRDAIYSCGHMVGIPIRNMHNVVYSIIGFNGTVKYKWDDLFYKQSYNADLSRAIEAEDEDMIATITGIMTGERVGSIKDKKALEVMNKLAGAGKDVIPRGISDTMTVDGVEYSLTNTQKSEFKTIYGDANEALADLVKLSAFGKASEDVQAKAIKRVYDTYYQLAQVEVLGTAQTKATLFSKVIDVEELALIVAYANSIEADTDKSGKAISGSRRLKIERYVQSLGCTAAEKYMIMGYLGYKNKNGEERVKSLISRYRLPKAERDALLKYCGY